jgi:nitrogen fixation protein FixH
MAGVGAVRSVRQASRGWPWPLAIVALLVAGAASNIAFMVVASGDASFAVEPDYYRKALDWDRTMAQEAANAALGWSVSVDFERGAGPGETRLVARVADRAGEPVGGATVAVQAFASARARQVFESALEPASAGVYTGSVPSARPGLWEVRVRVHRGEDVFTQILSRDLAAAAR